MAQKQFNYFFIAYNLPQNLQSFKNNIPQTFILTPLGIPSNVYFFHFFTQSKFLSLQGNNIPSSMKHVSLSMLASFIKLSE